MLYQAIFHKYGEHIHIPVEADTWEQAKRHVLRDNPTLADWPVTVKGVRRGRQAKDDRAELKFVEEPRMGRPSQGREKRLQAMITPDQLAWLEAQKRQRGEKSISDVVFKLFSELMSK